MKYAITTVLIVTLVAGAAFAQIQQSGKATRTESAAPVAATTGLISVSDFAADNVIGHLGHPLGTIVRVTGTAIDGNATRMKRNMGETLLGIHTVNGKQLKNKIVFDYPCDTKDIAPPKPGETFDYYVHESGSFHGVVVPPKKLEIEFKMVAHDGFHYRRYITIHKSLK